MLRATRACFSKVPKLFGRISGDIILFVSSKLRRLEARNFAVIFIVIPFILQHMKRPALQNKQAGVLRMAFRARKVFGTFEKRAPGRYTAHNCHVFFVCLFGLSCGLVIFRIGDRLSCPMVALNHCHLAKLIQLILGLHCHAIKK